MGTAPAKVKKPRPRAKRGHGKKQAGWPTNERDKKFCERWLVHHDHQKAVAEAGFANKNHREVGVQKLQRFRPYLERMLPKVELEVAKKIAIERGDILEAIARIGAANPQDYIKPFSVINAETQMLEQGWTMKLLHELTRDQAAALDTVFYSPTLGGMGYTLPTARTRLSALSTLGEQAAGFTKKPDSTIHQHLHFHTIPLEKIRAAKQMFLQLVSQEEARAVFGNTEADQAQ